MGLIKRIFNLQRDGLEKIKRYAALRIVTDGNNVN